MTQFEMFVRDDVRIERHVLPTGSAYLQLTDRAHEVVVFLFMRGDSEARLQDLYNPDKQAKQVQTLEDHNTQHKPVESAPAETEEGTPWF